MRIVSLVPSLTEYLWALGLDTEVVGITKFCVHPKAWKQTKEKVGGTKKVNFNVIERLKPDLIISIEEVIPAPRHHLQCIPLGLSTMP